MLTTTVLLFGNDDTSTALVDDRSLQRVVLNAATTIELSIEFPNGYAPVNSSTRWHVLRSESEKFFDWFTTVSDGFPLIVINLDAWREAVTNYNAWPTFESQCNFVIDQAGRGGVFELKYEYEGDGGRVVGGWGVDAEAEAESAAGVWQD